jgi:hypothetical protein
MKKNGRRLTETSRASARSAAVGRRPVFIIGPFIIVSLAQEKQLESIQDMATAFQDGGARGCFPRRFEPPGRGGLFRAPRYGLTYAGLIGKELKPGNTIEEILETNLPKQPQQR